MTNPPSSRPAIASTRASVGAALVVIMVLITITVLARIPAAHARAAPAASTAPVMVVLDASGSMRTADAPGPRILAAKAAVVGLVASLPTTARVGLTVYGTGTGSSPAERSAGCRDIHTLVPVGTANRRALVSAVSSVRARGYTPIGAALERAASSLPAHRPASIVLVSDGVDTCAPPPACVVAARLKQANHDLVIHTIGFRVDAGARSQLSCIARAAGGAYRDASDGTRLGAQLRGQVDAGLRPYIVTGTPIDGTPTPTAAPALSVGQFSDTFRAGPPVTKYYSISVTAPETVYVGTTIIPSALRGGGVTDRLSVATRLLDVDGDRCLSTERESSGLLAGKVDPVTAVLAAEVGGADWSKRCPTSGRFVVEVSRASTSSTLTRSETFVRVEPMARPVPAAVDVAPAGLAPPSISTPAAACVGGSNFASAPALRTGSCADSLATGETRYYRIRLGWGQRLAYQVVVDKVNGADHGSGFVLSAVATPLRIPVTLASSSNATRDFGGPASISVYGCTLVPVEYGNRDSPRSDFRDYRLAGDYYLSLGMTYPPDAAPYRTRVLIAVTVVGAAQTGPHYLALPATSVRTAAHPTTSSTPTAAAESPNGSSAWVWWTLAGVLPVVALAFVSLRSRRTGVRRR